ncbi:H/ACA ribonucleoprotein complex subunit dkc1 [Conglomerata obtusa]
MTSFTNSANWPLLLKNYEQMNIKSLHYTPESCGHTPLNRPINEYLKYGIVTIDKPCNPSSHEVVTWVKNILKVEKTGHCGTLDPKVSGCLTILLHRSTRLAKSMQSEGKEYVCTVEFHGKATFESFKKAINTLTGSLFQRPPLMCAVKRNLRLRNIESIEIVQFTEKEAIFKISCEAGTYIRTYCTHLGLLMGCGAHMKELRRTRSGHIKEDDCFTLHDLLDAKYLLDKKNEKVIRKVVQPLESLLLHFKRIIIKDSCVNAICYGAKLTIKGVLRYDDDIEIGSEIVLVSTKGEAVAICVAVISTSEIESLDHGIVCKIKRVIMEKDLYPRAWKLGEGEIITEVLEKKVTVC